MFDIVLKSFMIFSLEMMNKFKNVFINKSLSWMLEAKKLFAVRKK